MESLIGEGQYLDGNDLRALPWTDRRRQLEAFVPRLADSHFDLSQVIDATDFDDLAERRAGARDAAIEGVMLKRRDAPYVAGRRAGARALLRSCSTGRGAARRAALADDWAAWARTWALLDEAIGQTPWQRLTLCGERSSLTWSIERRSRWQLPWRRFDLGAALETP